MEKSVIRLFEVLHRGASGGCISLRHIHARTLARAHIHTHCDNQVSKKQTPANKWGKISSKRWYWCFIHVRGGNKPTKMIHLKPLKPADNPHARRAALGQRGMRKPLYIPLRSTWVNWWYICMFICLISLLQMSYRHIRGLTLRHNDIRASGGGYEDMRQRLQIFRNLWISCQLS